jgi:hypothetical protein
MLHVAVKRYNGDTKELEETDMMSFAIQMEGATRR